MNINPRPAADPIYLQRLEQALSVQPLVDEIEALYFRKSRSHDEDPDKTESSDSDSDSEYVARMKKRWKQLYQPADRQSDKEQLFNFSHVGPDREWLKSVLLSDTSDSNSDSDSYDINHMLREHVQQKKIRRKYYQDPGKAKRCMYYSVGLLSNNDIYKERQRQRRSHGDSEKKREDGSSGKIKSEPGSSSGKKHRKSNKHKTNLNPDDSESGSSPPKKPLTKKEVKEAKKTALAQSPGALTARRKKLWTLMAKKEINKVQRNKMNTHKETLSNCKKLAQSCMKFHRQKAMQSQKNMKETVWRAKRLTREMQAFWKKSDRYERETRRRMEKEAEEQRKLDVELIEAKRQQRKLNFLITQTELYAHFFSKKLGSATAEDQLRILNQLDEEKNPRLEAIDDYNSETQKALIMDNVRHAVEAEKQRSEQFGGTPDNPPGTEVERPQPEIFRGSLKHYQLKGMNWLANLYDQGISGILADEMGLGKTVQSIAFLCHIAETYDVWGPFLIISPASTLHNWQQEMERFVPDFKVVPYWGSPQERKILRQFWDQKNLHTKEASFHVVITSYQLVVSDFKYFNRIKWQYLILDEAQAIKSSNSMRWKLLLGFSCRNRLLLSGTPIQNSMAELWALLHFIMPSMFDSHDEFNEWFSKDIESHAENKTNMDERHLSRLHMILKPFMLRRIKKDVENELSDKIEIMVYCPLTSRQKLLYSALKKKIRIEDLISSSGNSSYQMSNNITSSLMNLVMQFRKVCNHPELFERRDAQAPLFLPCEDYTVPKLVFEEALLSRSIPSKRHILDNHCSVWHPTVSNHNLFHDQETFKFFSFLRLLGLSSGELYKMSTLGVLFRLLHLAQHLSHLPLTQLAQLWSPSSPLLPLLLPLSLPLPFLLNSGHEDSCIFTHSDHTLHCTPETIEHRLHRSRQTGEGGLLPEVIHVVRDSRVLPQEPTYLPACFFDITPKIATRCHQLYASSRACAWYNIEHEHCHSSTGLDIVWYGSPSLASLYTSRNNYFTRPQTGGLMAATPKRGWSNISIPDKLTLVYDAGKLSVLDELLKRLKASGHRVLIYSQMTKMIDLLEEFMVYRKYRYMRLDGSSKISERRDMVADFQNRAEIFVFLLSTRAGGLGINLTAADTVIFYDSDWNPTVDQQAMDRAHRLGQTKQVTVYRLICKDTIEERILQRAREKSEIQRMVISGGNFKPDTLKAKEVVSLLLDDAELEQKYQQKQLERKLAEEQRLEGNKEKDRERKRKQGSGGSTKVEIVKKIKEEDPPCVSVFDTSLGSPTNFEVYEEIDVMSSADNEPHFESPLISSPKLSSGGNSAVKKKPGKRGRPAQRRLVPGRDVGCSSLDPDGKARKAAGKRGPGRPRLKNIGPANQGYRGTGGRGHSPPLEEDSDPNNIGYEINVDQ
uniref:Chromatin-remodeling ATPase INO80 n=3 Tax=Cacopsylla melanoneura TaxID=428564 RepID=A0A8D9A723_9HEMI